MVMTLQGALQGRMGGGGGLCKESNYELANSSLWDIMAHFSCLRMQAQLMGECLPGARSARARRATFLLTIPTSARDLPSDGEGAPNRP